MSETISFVDAWNLWMTGQRVPEHLKMGPMTILWWGRTGKLLAFLGGVTIILDLLGRERIRAFAEDETDPSSIRVRLAAVLTLIVLSASLLIAREQNLAILGRTIGEWLTGYYLGLLLQSLLLVPAIVILIVLAQIAGTRRGERALRWVAAGLIAVGFQFDVLAS